MTFANSFYDRLLSRLSEASGLKYIPKYGHFPGPLSRLSEASGLKSIRCKSSCRRHLVSPLRGEWIEIIPFALLFLALVVSPLRGEWIEIHLPRKFLSESYGLASQRRVD